MLARECSLLYSTVLASRRFDYLLSRRPARQSLSHSPILLFLFFLHPPIYLSIYYILPYYPLSLWRELETRDSNSGGGGGDQANKLDRSSFLLPTQYRTNPYNYCQVFVCISLFIYANQYIFFDIYLMFKKKETAKEKATQAKKDTKRAVRVRSHNFAQTRNCFISII
jgi:hypothetical protein